MSFRGQGGNPPGLTHLEEAFGKARWFIPPFAQMGFLRAVSARILNERVSFSDDDLELMLSSLYEPQGLAAMVLERYPVVPHISPFSETIAEAVEAHFLGLDHLAVGGLVPVVEGAGRRLLESRGLPKEGGVVKALTRLAEDCKRQVIQGKIGEVGELISMLDSFANFARIVLYADSRLLSPDGTNRHGIAHGEYTDADYGRPLNFYKTIGAIDFLVLVSSLNARISWFAPGSTPHSMRLASFYDHLQRIGAQRPPGR